MTKAVNELSSCWSPEVRGLALKARELVLGVVPDAAEQADTSAKIIWIWIRHEVRWVVPWKAGFGHRSRSG